MRYGVAGQGFEDYVGFTGPLDFTAGGDAFGVGVEDDLEQDGGVIGGTAAVVVVVAGAEDG